jgi:hypothetical protein
MLVAYILFLFSKYGFKKAGKTSIIKDKYSKFAGQFWHSTIIDKSFCLCKKLTK